MKEVIVEVKEEKYRFFLELMKNFDFVKIKNNNAKQKLLINIARGMNESLLAAKGKGKSRPVKSLLNEL